jgi:hypothetical protein
MIKKILTLVCFLFVSTLVFASDFSKSSLVTPMFLRSQETDTIFRNPAELTIYDKVFETRFMYGVEDSRFSSLFIFHLPDNLSFGNTPIWNLGHFAFSLEYFGTNFGQNLMWIPDPEGGYFTIADGGYKMLFSWAKKTQYLTIGANIKTYHYRDLRETNSERNAVGLDLGIFLTPFKDLYLGASANDVGSTSLKDANGNVIVLNGQEQIIGQRVRLTAAVISGSDMAFSVGIPFSLWDDIQNNPRQGWKKIAFQGYKIFDNWLEVNAGSNTKELYAQVSFRLNEFISFGIIGARDLYSGPDINCTLTLSAGWPIESFANLISKNKNNIKKAQKEQYYKSRKERNEELNNAKKNDKLEKKLDRIEEKLDRIEDKSSTSSKKKSDDLEIYEEIEDDLNDKIKALEKKKKKINKLKRKQEILEELED